MTRVTRDVKSQTTGALLTRELVAIVWLKHVFTNALSLEERGKGGGGGGDMITNLAECQIMLPFHTSRQTSSNNRCFMSLFGHKDAQNIEKNCRCMTVY